MLLINYDVIFSQVFGHMTEHHMLHYFTAYGGCNDNNNNNNNNNNNQCFIKTEKQKQKNDHRIRMGNHMISNAINLE